MKRLLITVLCLTLTSSLFISCTNKDTTTTNNPSTESNENNTKKEISEESPEYIDLNTESLCNAAFKNSDKIDIINKAAVNFYGRIKSTFDLYDSSYSHTALDEFKVNSKDKGKILVYKVASSPSVISDVPSTNSLTGVSSSVWISEEDENYNIMDTVKFQYKSGDDVAISPKAKEIIAKLIDEAYVQDVISEVEKSSEKIKDDLDNGGVIDLKDDRKYKLSVYYGYDSQLKSASISISQTTYYKLGDDLRVQ